MPSLVGLDVVFAEPVSLQNFCINVRCIETTGISLIVSCLSNLICVNTDVQVLSEHEYIHYLPTVVLDRSWFSQSWIWNLTQVVFDAGFPLPNVQDVVNLLQILV